MNEVPQQEGCAVVEHSGRHRNVRRFRGGLVFKAHRLLYHSTLGSRVIKKKKKAPCIANRAESGRATRDTREEGPWAPP